MLAGISSVPPLERGDGDGSPVPPQPPHAGGCREVKQAAALCGVLVWLPVLPTPFLPASPPHAEILTPPIPEIFFFIPPTDIRGPFLLVSGQL